MIDSLTPVYGQVTTTVKGRTVICEVVGRRRIGPSNLKGGVYYRLRTPKGEIVERLRPEIENYIDLLRANPEVSEESKKAGRARRVPKS